VAARSLTVGNAAKLYCLDLIEARARGAASLRILDLGCGDGRNFVELLRRFPQVEYVGYDPSQAAVDAARRGLDGLRAEVHRGDVHALKLSPPADVVVSFSVLEHVRRRREYLAAVAPALAVGGVALVNYDAGHFGREATRADRAKTLLRLQAKVDRDEFRSEVASAGLRIADEKAFNTDLKLAFRDVPIERHDEFMRRWLETELYLNGLGLGDRDDLWRTRNYVLERG
jgi:SAM-dependent methyltransferase